jgi:hypothetical protein
MFSNEGRWDKDLVGLGYTLMSAVFLSEMTDHQGEHPCSHPPLSPTDTAYSQPRL